MVELSCIMHVGMTMLRPEIESWDGKVPWLDDPLELEDLDPPLAFKAKAAVDFSGDGDSSHLIEIRWLGNVDAYYVVELHPGVMPGLKLRTQTTKKGCELLWQSLVPPDDAITY